MRKRIVILVLVIVLLGIGVEIIVSMRNSEDDMSKNKVVHNVDKSTSGWLTVDGTLLKDVNGEIVQLKGLSTHGLSWYPHYIDKSAIAATKDQGANVFRAAMYTDDKNGGYTQNNGTRRNNKNLMSAAIDNALGLDMYVVVDWHILEDNDPLDNVDEAMEFFEEISSQYSSEPGVVYEICNEPNGSTTWADIKEYAEKVIPVIRNNSPKALILVGTPNFSSDLLSPSEDKLNYENIMYSYHYYTEFPEADFKGSLDFAKREEMPVFVSEWGMGFNPQIKKMDTERGTDFLRYARENNISWCAWSLSNKDEDYSVIKSDVDKIGNWTYDDLTEPGKVIFDGLKDKY